MRYVPFVILLAACGPGASSAPRYAAEIFSEDTIPVPVTVRVTGAMQVSLNGAGFYSYKGQPVVLTPATLVVRGTGSAIIAATDSSKPIAIVPAGIPLDSTEKTATVARIFKLSRPEGTTAYRLERLLPE
jgi:hypothetical protein